MKKRTFLRNLAAFIARIERRWYKCKLDPKNIEIVNQVEKQEQKIF